MRVDLLLIVRRQLTVQIFFQQLTANFITNSSVGTDLLSHLRAGAVQISLQLRKRETRNRGDLFVTALVQHLEREYQPLVFVERGQRAPDKVVQLLAQKPFDRYRFVVA